MLLWYYRSKVFSQQNFLEMNTSNHTAFSRLSEKYGDMFVSPGELPIVYPESRIYELVSGARILETVTEDDVVVTPAPPFPIGDVGIHRMSPGLFSSLPEEWGKEMGKGVDPFLYQDQTSDSLWYLFRIPRESYGIPYEDQTGLRRDSEIVPSLAEVLWMLEAFALAGKKFPVGVGHVLRTSSRSSDGAVLSVLRWEDQLTVSDCLGCEADPKSGMPFLKAV